MPSTRDLDQQAPSIALQRSHIPNLDVAALFNGNERARELLVKQIREACRTTGFLYIHNTCVSDTVIEAALDASRRFFAADDDGPLKQGVHNRLAGKVKGWGPMYGEPAYQPGTVAHVESFDIGQQLSHRECRELGIPPNIWPDLPGFREAVLDYYAAVNCLGRHLSEVICELLEQPPGYIRDHSGKSAPRTLRLLHYPANDAPADGRNVGISAHTDFECFTIMNQTAAGLELTDTQGRWCQAPSDIGTFTLMLGDMTERLSNGRFQATGHRVVNTPWTRYSLILFFALDGNFEVEPLPQFVSDDRPAAYPPITQDAHIEAELARAENHG